MRGGPGLGSIQPGQADYNQGTRGGSNGDYHTIVLAPNSIQEAIDMIGKAFDLSLIHISFLLDAQPQYSQLDPEDLLIDREKAAALLNQVRSQRSELEVRVLDLYVDGCSCGEIAATVGKSYKSVDKAVQRIRRKIGRQISSGEISNG